LRAAAFRRTFPKSSRASENFAIFVLTWRAGDHQNEAVGIRSVFRRDRSRGFIIRESHLKGGDDYECENKNSAAHHTTPFQRRTPIPPRTEQREQKTKERFHNGSLDCSVMGERRSGKLRANDSKWSLEPCRHPFFEQSLATKLGSVARNEIPPPRDRWSSQLRSSHPSPLFIRDRGSHPITAGFARHIERLIQSRLAGRRFGGKPDGNGIGLVSNPIDFNCNRGIVERLKLRVQRANLNQRSPS